MGLDLLTARPVEGGALTVGVSGGPFAQPAPVLLLRFDGNRLIATTYVVDFTYPNLPTVPSVQATIPAPAAGAYTLVHVVCGGNPPPPVPVCSTVSQQGFEIAPAFSVPVVGTVGLGVLALGVAALAAQRIERALTAFDRLRV